MCPTEFCGCDPEANHRCERHAPYGPSIEEAADIERAGYATPQTPTCEFPQEQLGGQWVPTCYPPFPDKAEARKTYPVATGVLDYFPLAIMEVAHVSWAGNQQHHPDKPLHWDRLKSSDEADALLRHFIQRGKFDTDGIRHSAKVVWRALAYLEKELEAAHESD